MTRETLEKAKELEKDIKELEILFDAIKAGRCSGYITLTAPYKNGVIAAEVSQRLLPQLSCIVREELARAKEELNSL